MTEFENTVRKALRSLLREHTHAYSEDADRMVSWISGPEHVADKLAPRIAAAIEASATQTTVNIGCAIGPGVIAEALGQTPPTTQWHEAALAALRGETP